MCISDIFGPSILFSGPKYKMQKKKKKQQQKINKNYIKVSLTPPKYLLHDMCVYTSIFMHIQHKIYIFFSLVKCPHIYTYVCLKYTKPVE